MISRRARPVKAKVETGKKRPAGCRARPPTAISAFTGRPVGWTAAAVVLSFLVCTVIGLVSGIYPALQSSRLDPIEALRHD